MAALSFLKFLKPSVSFSSSGTETPPSVYDYYFSDEDDDSLFELELNDSVLYGNPEPKISNQNNKSKQSTPSCQSPMNNFFSRRKILPIDSQPNSRPQSPSSIFKSPKFPFRKSKSLPMPEKKKTGEKQSMNRARSNLSSYDNVSPSKRFSKDVVQKYLKFVKPSNLKCSDPFSSPVNLSKKSGKGRVLSAVAAVNGVSSPVRKDDSILHGDGIQSAILHCKKSFLS